MIGWPIIPKLPKVQLPKKSTAELIREYRTAHYFISQYMYAHGGSRPDKSDFLMTDLSRIEAEIVEQIPDLFQRSVFRILAHHEFDITDFLKDENGHITWQEEIRNTLEQSCNFLFNYGQPAGVHESRKFTPLPFSGEEFMLWFLQEVKNSPDSKNPNSIVRVLGILNPFLKSGIILGHNLQEESMKGIGDRLLVIFVGEYANRMAVVIDIFCDSNEGEQFIREILNTKSATNL